ncbi:hypothetical protein KY284_019393 [Solanum tuberosum]|nr:hypothetical protein KY284_019393 [Solanum tuberosum]
MLSGEIAATHWWQPPISRHLRRHLLLLPSSSPLHFSPHTDQQPCEATSEQIWLAQEPAAMPSEAHSSSHQRNQQLPAALDSSAWRGTQHQQLPAAPDSHQARKSAAAGEKHICDQRVTSNSRRPLATSSGGHFFWDFKGI